MNNLIITNNPMVIETLNEMGIGAEGFDEERLIDGSAVNSDEARFVDGSAVNSDEARFINGDAVNSDEARFINGSVEVLLIAVRDMIYRGHRLVSHPSAASIRMICSPYRTVIVSARPGAPDPAHARMAEDVLTGYRRITRHRKTDIINAESYKKIDLQLFLSAYAEPLPFL